MLINWHKLALHFLRLMLRLRCGPLSHGATRNYSQLLRFACNTSQDGMYSSNKTFSMRVSPIKTCTIRLIPPSPNRFAVEIQKPSEAPTSGNADGPTAHALIGIAISWYLPETRFRIFNLKKRAKKCCRRFDSGVDLPVFKV